MKELWLTNLNKQDINISDLNLIIRSMRSINILSSKLKLDRKEIAKSLESGTLRKKRHLLILGLGKPTEIAKKPVEAVKIYLPGRSKSMVTATTVEIKSEDGLSDKSDEDFIIEQLNEDDGK